MPRLAPPNAHSTHASPDTFPQQPLYNSLPQKPPTPSPPNQTDRSNQTRTDTSLNLSVLQRHLPTITSIDLIVPYAVIYIFRPQQSSWEKSGIEGTLFVVQTHATLPHQYPQQAQEGYAIVVLNRRGLENFILPLKTSEEVELTDEYVILREEDGGEEGKGKIWGVWVFEEEEGSTAGMRRMCGEAVLERARWVEGRDGGVGEGKGEKGSPDLMALLNGGRESRGVASPATITHTSLGRGQGNLLHLFKQAG